jgi:hypothetical protein
MKRKAPKILRLFMVLALVVGVIGTVVPAAKVGAAGSSTVALSTLKANKNATYTVTTASMTSIPTNGTVTVTFPSGTTVPASIDNTSVSINGVAPTADPLVVGRAVTITHSGSAVTTPVIQFAASAGIINPTSIGSKTLGIKSSADATGHTSGAFVIARSLAFSPSSGAVQGGTITLTGTGFTGGVTINASGSVSGSAVVESNGNFTIVGSRKGTGTFATVTDGAGNVLGTGPTAVPLKSGLTASGTPAITTGVISLEGRNYTVASLVALTGITFGGVALATTNMVTTLPLALTDRDLDGTLDDFKVQFRVPTGTGTGERRVSVTDGTATATVDVTVAGRSITISPTSGRTGTITVTGTGFPPSVAGVSGTDEFRISQVGVSGDITGSTISTDTAGGFTTTFTMPSSIPGGNPIATGALSVKAVVKATSGDVGENTASATYTWTSVSGSLTVTPTSGPRGTVVTVTGSGYTASGNFAFVSAGSASNGMTIGGVGLNSAQVGTNADGNVTASTQTVPSGVAYGANTVKAKDNSARSGSAAFTVIQPTTTITPASGPVGSSITVTGSGWLPNGLVTIARSGTSALTTTANALGEITAQLPIPSSLFTGGGVNVTVGASDGSGNAAASQIFKISSAAITVSPASAAVGDTVTVTGSNYLPSTGLVTLTVGGVSVKATAPVISDSTGGWSTTFAVPGLSGVQTVSTSHSSVVKTATLTITAAVAGGAVATATATSALTALELVTSFDYASSLYQAYVPSLAGNVLTEIKPNSVIIVTLTADATVIVSGVSFAVTAGVPTPLPVGNTVSITLG